MGRNRRTIAAAALLAVVCAAAPAGAQTPVYDPDPAMEAAATREGRVVLYTTWIVDQLARPMITAFEKRFPKIKVDFVRGDSSQNLMKMVTEKKAGAPQSDVWSLSAGFDELYKVDGVQPVDLPSTHDLPPQYKDARGRWFATYIVVHVPSYNTSMIAAKDLPRTYEDLLDPRWKGKLVWKRGDVTGSSGFLANILTSFGDEKGKAYLRELAKQNIIGYEGSVRALLDNVVSGEYGFALTTVNFHAAISAAQGAPVKWFPIEPVAVSMTSGGVTKGGPHPNAARLFLDFVMSKAGQTVIRDVGYLPVRPDMPALYPELKPEQGGFRANFIRPDQVDENYAKWQALEKEIFR